MGPGGGGRTRVSPGSPSAPLPGCQSTARPGLHDHGSPASGDSPRRSWAGGPAWGQGGGVSRGSRPHPTQAQPSPPGHIMSPEPPNTPSLPTPSPKWTGLSSSPERPWVKPGEGGEAQLCGRGPRPPGASGTRLSWAPLSSDCPLVFPVTSHTPQGELVSHLPMPSPRVPREPGLPSPIPQCQIFRKTLGWGGGAGQRQIQLHCFLSV